MGSTASNTSSQSEPEAQGRCWYVVFTKPRQESKAMLNLVNQGYDVWLPMLTIWRKSAGQWLRKDVPLFPRYLFVRPSRGTQSVAPVRSTVGVMALVRFGNESARLSESLLNELRDAIEAKSIEPDERISPFVIGEEVHVTSGPLAGIAGVVIRPAIERVAVLLSLLGRESEVFLKPEMLGKVA